jgi:hypothetical protein
VLCLSLRCDRCLYLLHFPLSRSLVVYQIVHPPIINLKQKRSEHAPTHVHVHVHVARAGNIFHLARPAPVHGAARRLRQAGVWVLAEVMRKVETDWATRALCDIKVLLCSLRRRLVFMGILNAISAQSLILEGTLMGSVTL